MTSPAKKGLDLLEGLSKFSGNAGKISTEWCEAKAKKAAEAAKLKATFW